MKKIVIFSLILCLCFLTTVSASDNCTSDFIDSQDVLSVENLNSHNYSQEVLSIGESEDNPVTDADQLSSKFFSVAQFSSANIYLANNNYSFNNKIFDSPKNVTFIGQGENTILRGISTQASPGVQPSELSYALSYTFINLTFVGGTNDLSRSCKFINCTIIDSLTFSKDFFDHPDKLNIRKITQDRYALRTYFYDFDNCVFKNYDGNSSYLTAYQYACVSFNNCNFTNISADSIVCYASDASFEKLKNYLSKLGWDDSEIKRVSYDGLYFENCLFKDSKYNAITDSYVDVSRNITNCNDIKSNYYGVFTSEDGLHQYYSLPIPKNASLTVRIGDISYGESVIIEVALNYPICDDVVVAFNKNKYVVKVINGVGLTEVSDDLDAGVWNFQADATYNNFTVYSNFTVNKLNTKTTVPNVSSPYNGGKYLVITLKDSKNNVLNNAPVNIKVGSAIYNKKTNVNGQIRLSIDGLTPNTYNVIVSYGGNNNYECTNTNSKLIISKANPKLAAKKATFKVKVKTKKYSIILKDNRNKAMKKVKVTLKIKGKTYKATTNAKGKATFKITKLTKKGNYKSVVNFKGSKYYNSLKKIVKIKVK